MNVFYRLYNKGVGWTETTGNGLTAGSPDGQFQAEAIQIGTDGNLNIDVQIHVQHFGWLDYSSGMEPCGYIGTTANLEALRCKLWGVGAEDYNIYYRVHIANFGWLSWAKDGEIAGAVGLSMNIDAFEAHIINVSDRKPSVRVDYPHPNIEKPAVILESFYDECGWVTQYDSYSGTYNLKGIRCELISSLTPQMKIVGSMHTKEEGWLKEQDAILGIGSDNICGNIDAIYFKLEGNYANLFDIWYRSRVENRGWLGWTKNGSPSGTDGCSLSLEAVEIQIQPKSVNQPPNKKHSYERFVLPNEADKSTNTSRNLLITTAYSQEGVQEYEYTTKYGEWMGSPATEWAQCFVSWCANEAGISSNNIPYISYIPSAVNYFKIKHRWRTRSEGYLAQLGDLIYFDLNGDGVADHVGIVSGISKNGFITTIEGNTGTPSIYVQVKKWAENNPKILGYGLPF